jgi:hypothetical protein
MKNTCDMSDGKTVVKATMLQPLAVGNTTWPATIS